MNINSKSYYILAILILISKYETNEKITTKLISEKLNISKVYTEQLFALLKKHHFVKSIKGSNGGYILNKDINKINLYDILSITENKFDKIKLKNIDLYPFITETLSNCLNNISQIIIKELKNITIKDLTEYSDVILQKDNPMYYI